MLDREEYVEQAYLFRSLGERLPESTPVQELLVQIKNELLATTRLPLAIDFMLGELKHIGTMSTAMARLPHYFSPFQTYVIQEAERDQGRFDLRIAVEILHHEATYRAASGSPQGIFLYQFECLCRNRMRYDPGLAAMAGDPSFDENWRQWLDIVRRQIGLVDFADMIYFRSQYYLLHRRRPGEPIPAPEKPVLFGEKEGKIAWANRQKDPLYLFAALQRQLGYPHVPRPKKAEDPQNNVTLMRLRIERLETRIKLLEEENRGGIDITKFYGPKGNRLTISPPPDLDNPSTSEL